MKDTRIKLGQKLDDEDIYNNNLDSSYLKSYHFLKGLL